VGLPPLEPEEEKFVFIHTIKEGIERVIPPDLQPAAYQEKERIRVEDLVPLIRLQKGIRRFLAFLADRGIAAAVVTNGGHEALGILQALGIKDYFGAVVTADDVSPPKPHPKGALQILRDLGLDPGQACFIGDSIVDEQTARNAGLGFWSYQNPVLKADLYFDSFLDLKKLMED
jgi:HAD superfamily hydrolase (TIGR01509 family)